MGNMLNNHDSNLRHFKRNGNPLYGGSYRRWVRPDPKAFLEPERQTSSSNFAVIAFGIVAGTILLTEAQNCVFGDPKSCVKGYLNQVKGNLETSTSNSGRFWKCLIGLGIAIVASKEFLLRGDGQQRDVNPHQGFRGDMWYPNSNQQRPLTSNGKPSPSSILFVLLASTLTLTGLSSLYGKSVHDLTAPPYSNAAEKRRDFVNDLLSWMKWPPTVLVCVGVMAGAFRMALHRKRKLDEMVRLRDCFPGKIFLAGLIGILGYLYAMKQWRLGRETSYKARLEAHQMVPKESATRFRTWTIPILRLVLIMAFLGAIAIVCLLRTDFKNIFHQAFDKFKLMCKIKMSIPKGECLPKDQESIPPPCQQVEKREMSGSEKRAIPKLETCGVSTPKVTETESPDNKLDLSAIIGEDLTILEDFERVERLVNESMSQSNDSDSPTPEKRTRILVKPEPNLNNGT